MRPGGRWRLPGPARDVLANWLVRRADEANLQRDWARAERLYAGALWLNPDRPHVHVQHGHALKEQGFPHRAAAAYRAAAARAGRTTDAWAQLGHVLELLGRPHGAAEAFAAALRADNAPAQLHDDLARVRSAGRSGPASGQQTWACLLEAHDLGPAVPGLLDQAFYRAADPALADADLWDLIDHFGRTGVDRLMPLNPHAVFDPAFYAQAYPDASRLPPSRAYRHWLTLGVRMGRHPNRTAWLDHLYAAQLRLLAPGARSFALAAVAHEAQVHEARAGAGAPWFAWLDADHRPLLPTVPAAQELEAWLTLADGLDRAGRGRDGDRLREAAIRRWPDEAQAATTRRRGASAGRGSADHTVWTAAAVAERSAAQASAGDWLGALATLGAGVRAIPENADLRERLADTADRAIRTAWRAAERMDGAGEGLDEARAVITTVLRAVVEAVPQPPPLAPRPIARVAIVGNADLPQCRFYRIDQKLEQLAEAGYEAAFFDETTDMPRFLAQMVGFEAVLFYRVPAHFHVLDAILAARALGLVTIYEIDDLLFDGAHYPAPIASYGGGLDPAQHRGLALAVPMYAEAMALCDHALASTDALAAAMRPHVRTGRAFVHPNALASVHAQFAALPAPARPGRRVTVFYGSNTLAHKDDLRALVEPALTRLVERHGDGVSILLVGPVESMPALQALGANVTAIEAMPLSDYWALLRTADIVIAPLIRTPATDAKSGIKWLEAAMLGVPAVVSRTATTERLIEDGRNGFLCDTAADWTATLDRLVADAGLRRAVGDRAKADAVERFAPERAAANLRAILDSLSPPPVAARPTVVVVNVFYPPQAFGGATRVVHDNVRDLTIRHRDDLEVAVFATLAAGGEPYRVRSAPFEGVRVTTVTASGTEATDMGAADPTMGAAFDVYLAAVRPALVHFHCVQRLTASVVDAARRRNVPYLITMHDGWWISPYQFLLDDELAPAVYDYADPGQTLGRLGRPALDRMLVLAPALAGARAVLAVSDAFAEVVAGSHACAAVAVPNGVSPIACPVRTPSPDGRVRLGYLGGAYARKGWLLIQEVLRELDAPHLRLLVVDHAMAATERRHEQWGTVAVEVRGKCPPANVGEVYAGIDVLLAPSIWPESFGLVAREALHCGCWVVASDRGAMADDVMEGVNGFVVDVSGPAGLREALLRIDAEPERFRRSPPPPPGLRPAQAQADDLAAIYRSILRGSGTAQRPLRP